jgi:hypothetical protein
MLEYSTPTDKIHLAKPLIPADKGYSRTLDRIGLEKTSERYR